MAEAFWWLVMLLVLASNAIGVVLSLLQLPGTWLIALTMTLLAWWRPGRVPWLVVAVLVAMALLGEALELLASARGVRKAGGSRRGAVGALAASVGGAVLGSLVLPVVGTLLGACLGAGLGSYLGDRWAGRSHRRAVLAGRGAAAGRFRGTVLKVGLAVAMWAVAAVALGRAVLDGSTAG
jgi:uncharacterized protein YqgC (DUF456 family)